ncbi:MAG: hypothetical protein A2Y10_01650 [Planctomycetes bacterium GWF2_41_51]|nr:MAG: hypothetical protein A2Y10_01650 [Planctomycetes bacterium GWF2_41_51]
MIKFDNVDLAYNGKKVFAGLSLEIKEGEKVAISGRSGIGKSSLFSLILGFTEPAKGKVLFNGICVDEKTAWNVRKQISFIDQDVSVGVNKVSEWISFVAGLKSNSAIDFGEKKVKELMSFFELDHSFFNKNISDLSGGERQRIAIILSALLGRKIFLLDEVTSALDKHLKKKAADFFIGKKEWTVLIISHDSVWVENTPVKVFDLEAGKWKQ